MNTLREMMREADEATVGMNKMSMTTTPYAATLHLNSVQN
jgi:hypothetical protein